VPRESMWAIVRITWRCDRTVIRTGAPVRVFHSRSASAGRLVRELRSADRGLAVHRGVLDPFVRHFGRTRVRSLSSHHERWRSTPAHFFLPVRVLSRVFRGKFVAGLRRAFRANQLAFHGECLSLANEKTFTAFLHSLFQEDWVVYAKPPFGGPQHVLHYLARYTHRVAISNHRILTVNESEVTFRWKDYAHHNKQRTMTLTCEEFLRRFLQHLLPKGFSRIRYFGWLAHRRRSKLLPLCRVLLPNLPEQTPATLVHQTALWRCPRCHGPMSVLERLTAAQLLATVGRQEFVLDTS